MITMADIEYDEDGMPMVPHPSGGMRRMDSGWTYYGVIRKLEAMVGHDPRRIPRNSWSGTPRELADQMRLPLQTVCDELGLPVELIADQLILTF